MTANKPVPTMGLDQPNAASSKNNTNRASSTNEDAKPLETGFYEQNRNISYLVSTRSTSARWVGCDHY